MASCQPKSEWLSKLNTSSFGRSKWSSRFFVLLDSELRYYKDEHAIIPSATLSLRDICKVVVYPMPNYPYCFRLEPNVAVKMNGKKSQQPWTMKCQSKFELEAWVDTIQYRLTRLSGFRANHLPLPSPSKRQPLRSFIRLFTSSNPLNPPKVHDLTPPVFEITQSTLMPTPRPQRKNAPSLSRRRGVILSPIIIESLPFLDSNSIPSTSSGNESPVLDRIHIPYSYSSDINDCKHLKTEFLSPTFLAYKERFL
ncbi:hypothetical protein BDF14DRAFT_1766070 [Spinellus fusiger]|nr:hypothetical protein BDF14DRAFT_1766070 [Spinellus fusiger]